MFCMQAIMWLQSLTLRLAPGVIAVTRPTWIRLPLTTWSIWMEMHKTPLKIVCAALLAAGVVMTPELTNAGAARTNQPAISMAHARKTALKAYRGGKIAKEELEKEGGGSGLRYTFDIRQGSTIYEVGVDAMTGRVLEKTTESTQDEAAESAIEANEKD
jgi:Peptidase propeptide and YPEB domain